MENTMPYDPHKAGNIKPSIAAALKDGGPVPVAGFSRANPSDEAHPTGPRLGDIPYGQGGFGGAAPQTHEGQQQALGDNPTGPRDEAVMKAAEDAMLYGEGYVRMQGEDRMPGGMAADIRETPDMPLGASPRLMTPPPSPAPFDTEFFDFGCAIRSMECGLRVQRRGWNGRDMWIALSGMEGPREVQAADLWSRNAKNYALDNGGAALVLPCIIMKTATGEILMGWLASQSDMLAKDWRIVD
jgi:hypothetical protein